MKKKKLSFPFWGRKLLGGLLTFFKKRCVSPRVNSYNPFLIYASEAHNILMTGLGTHERFTIPMRTCVQHAPKKMSILSKDTEYNCRKIILGTLGFKLSFQKGRYKLHKVARFTCTCITRLSTF